MPFCPARSAPLYENKAVMENSLKLYPKKELTSPEHDYKTFSPLQTVNLWKTSDWNGDFEEYLRNKVSCTLCNMSFSSRFQRNLEIFGMSLGGKTAPDGKSSFSDGEQREYFHNNSVLQKRSHLKNQNAAGLTVVFR